MPPTPTSEPISDSSDEAEMPDMVAKRRNGHTPLLPKSPNTTPVSLPLPPALSFVAGRKRRLFAYLAAFATMLALSSMLDLRRAALSAKRHDRITLQPPPGPPATAMDEETHPADGAAVAHEAQVIMQRHNNNAVAPKPPPLVSNVDHHHDVHGDEVHAHPSIQNSEGNTVDTTEPQTKTAPSVPDRKLSDQELADDVDQLISHVEQENAVANSTASAANNSSTTVTKGTTASSITTTPTSTVQSNKGSATATGDKSSPVPAVNVTTDDTSGTVEEQFGAAQAAMDAAASNDTLKVYLDPQEARTLKALALQGARGDCGPASDPSGGGLFKTDAEVTSGDIEKTDALWGAWCVFSGRYKSDAMRDYVTRTRTLRARLIAKAEAGAPLEPSEPFDENLATLDDILPADQQASLKAKAEALLPNLREPDARLLAALSLQATLGDCAHYTKTPPKKRKGDEPVAPPRELSEPVLGKTANRGEGALWGAWCVFARRKRAAAVVTLRDRIEQFYQQLAMHTAPGKGGVHEHGVVHRDAATAR